MTVAELGCSGTGAVANGGLADPPGTLAGDTADPEGTDGAVPGCLPAGGVLAPAVGAAAPARSGAEFAAPLARLAGADANGRDAPGEVWARVGGVAAGGAG